MEWNAVIVEDEHYLAQVLEKMIGEVKPECNILTKLTGVNQAIEWFRNHPEPCLVFMDIQLADGICFDVFEAVDLSNKGIVFTTAYDEYMLDAFEYNSISYLLKPIKKDSLIKVFEKIENIMSTFGQEQQGDYQHRLSQLAQHISKIAPRFRQRFMIAKADGYIQLPVHDIACFYVVEKVVQALSFGGKIHVLDFTLDKLEEELDQDIFFRANRQYIINLNAIERIENYFGGKLIIRLKPEISKEKIVVSRSKAQMLKKWLDR
ncbi:LytR/AlgR family response regulator transcription factor [Alkalitalea saponilacus]|uniref:Two component transcriptional regulator, LytTR family n=1 Tax=Alkalitalea saponilacus TaxID=889453 RepID=A0A1T5FNK5_9BACT|nr:LytTR family DNA-binding domain-containing protein [Alkalitalea saponilacus]ASB49449.1 DNA-binding response regulator [Alkalitalea saponilacus]SKB97692.1 two component transcriptional regulator, LytTR family [Alkalitalea saponilacus]